MQLESRRKEGVRPSGVRGRERRGGGWLGLPWLEKTERTAVLRRSSASNTIYQYQEDGEESDTSNEGGNDSDAGDDDDAALGEPTHAEQLLPSGDF
ncbi:hypothetical protein C2845_PM06G13590 [Panicum miliaceum]|uniref:Uncharacterized protein n=1 Tax=Panicum miliaceum TaxID=4540 RepID=A0A3L6RDJ7_PANMI|nr:hypothetical protein C2845_PM06G13590 [Panicum miliaceum]